MSAPIPPATAKIATTREFHGDTFTDHYEWLRNKESEEVISYLTSENDFTNEVTADQQPLRERIFQEIKERTLETDLSVPQRIGDWWYFSRTVEGEQYPVFSRLKVEGATEKERLTPPTPEPGVPLTGEETILDCNEFARDLPFFALGSYTPADNGKILGFSVDDSGDELFTQYFLNLETGELLDERIENIFAGSFLTPDAASLIYLRSDDSWRPYQVYRHAIGASTPDQLLLEEADTGMWQEATTSTDRSALLLGSGNSEYSEYRVLPYDEPSDRLPAPVISRDEKVLYEVEPLTLNGQKMLLLVHNFEAENSELVLAPYPQGESFADYRAQWIPLMCHREDVRLEDVSVSATHLVVTARIDTTVRILLTPIADLPAAIAQQQEPVFTEPAGFTEEIYTCTPVHTSVDSPLVRFIYESWVTPSRVYDYLPAQEELFCRRETPVLGGFEADQYTARREWAKANDGTLIPLSIIHRSDLDLTQPHPVLQYGYGSYEVAMDPYFSIARLSLLDRGVIWVVAHIRGGGEMGRSWYLDGKKLKKINTFTDFIAASDYIGSQPWADSTRIAAMGGSAGGLLMGAVANMAPEKYRAVLAQVPFVDALTTILDPDLPLSALEWEEWGNPIESKEVYEYMKSYTPYENIRPVAYPAIAAVTSLNDTRVFYVEPAKWVAALRDTIAPASPTPLLKIEMDGGHGGGSGRYTQWKEAAWNYAWLLTHLKATNHLPHPLTEQAAQDDE